MCIPPNNTALTFIMFEPPKSSHTLGLDQDSFSLKKAALSYFRGSIKIDYLLEYNTDSTLKNKSYVKPLYTKNHLKIFDSFLIFLKKSFDSKKSIILKSAYTKIIKLYNSLSTKIIALYPQLKVPSTNNFHFKIYDLEEPLTITAIPAQDILVRPFEIKLTKIKDIDAALIFQIEPLLPYPADQAVIEKLVLSKETATTKLLILALKKDDLIKHLTTWKQNEIEPEIVSAAPEAIVIFGNQFIEKETPYFIIHLGIINSFCVLVDNKKLNSAKSCFSGLKNLIDLIAKELACDTQKAFESLLEIDFTNSLIDKSPNFKKELETLKNMILQTIYSLEKQFKGVDVNAILFTGEAYYCKWLTEYLVSFLKKENLKIQTPYPDISSKTLLLYALPIGQALSGLPTCRNQINFRQQEFAYPNPWKRIKKPLLQYFSLCLVLAFSLFIFGKTYISYKIGEIKTEYISLINSTDKSYETFEKEYNTKITKKIDVITQDPSTIKHWSTEDVIARLNYLEKTLLSFPKTYPLFPNTPLVSDVLAWISSHKQFVNKDDNTSLHIENFNYTMVKRPEPSKKQEKYQVKIELEFSSLTPKMAREFHDALIAPNEIVDPKGEIKWSSNKDLYRTSFYLKDKTVYPINNK